MTGDIYKHAAAGEAFSVNHRTWNGMLDAGRDFSERRVDGSEIPPLDRPANFHVIKVKNNAGNVPNRGIVGIQDPIFTSVDNEDFFKGGLQFIGVDPIQALHTRSFAVALEPSKAGDIFKAVYSGIVQCKVDIRFTVDTHAVIQNNNVNQLESAPGGPARIIWREDDQSTGVQWALVKLKDEVPFFALSDSFMPIGEVSGSAKRVRVDVQAQGPPIYTPLGVAFGFVANFTDKVVWHGVPCLLQWLGYDRVGISETLDHWHIISSSSATTIKGQLDGAVSTTDTTFTPKNIFGYDGDIGNSIPTVIINPYGLSGADSDQFMARASRDGFYDAIAMGSN